MNYNEWVATGRATAVVAVGLNDDYDYGQHLRTLKVPGGGINLHAHTNAYNVLVAGRKRWFLYPPTRMPMPHYPAAYHMPQPPMMGQHHIVNLAGQHLVNPNAHPAPAPAEAASPAAAMPARCEA